MGDENAAGVGEALTRGVLGVTGTVPELVAAIRPVDELDVTMDAAGGGPAGAGAGTGSNVGAIVVS